MRSSDVRGAGRACAAAGMVMLLAAGCGLGAGRDGSADGSAGSTPLIQQPPGPVPETGEQPPLPPELTGQTLDWRRCGEPGVLQGGGPAPGDRWQCASLTVPVDYADPGGETLEIAVIRTRSTGGDRDRIGSLVFNFGGPGGSGVARLPRLADRYRTLQAGFDLVSFDPRGVGESAGVQCLEPPEIEAAGQSVDSTPDTPEEIRALLTAKRTYAEGCSANAGPLLPHLTTAGTARDMDLLRQALGDGQLNYFGSSYGTKLGGVYAHLFPERVGRMVFDAVVDPTRDVVDRALGQAEGFQLALDNYLTHCAGQPECPVGRSVTEGRRAVGDLLTELDGRPLPGDGERLLTQSLAVTGVVSALYSERSWAHLTQALESALSGDGGPLLAMADGYNGRSPDGRYNNLHAANTAINCADFASRPDVATVREHRAAFEEVSPVFGEFLVWGLLGCSHWPVTGERDQPRVHAAGARPILLIGTTGDPATPYAGAERMREELGEGVGVLLTLEGEGHGAYQGGADCVGRAVDGHLLSGAVPPDGLVCR
ncbi:alpha/beta hydrolase [Streptomyces sodiiphilus]|uniref:Alpha/beta hydrolase n=1 Tax=Streptomyces sodiiphilus TaxID=226217 RepID=A0ABN2NXC1_9ACTN